jgi:myo-inositol-1(or 4)-monophosphatase
VTQAPSRAPDPPPAAAEDALRDGAFAGELAFALETAQRAGELQVERSESVGRIDYKSAKDVVTEVDHLSEALILNAIREAFPGDALLAEETGGHVAASGHEATSGVGRVWVVDPLDGTINYANGIPFHCVSIALAIDGRAVVGVIHDPVRRESYAASSDSPALLYGSAALQPSEVRASVKEQLSDYVVSMSLSGRAVISRIRTVRKAVRVSRNMGSASLALAYVANGRFDAFVQQGGLSTWDVAAAGLIAERAGATVTDLEGGPWFDITKPTRSIGLLAAPPTHHGELLKLAAS